MSAPARRMAVTCSASTASPSSQPRSAAAANGWIDGEAVALEHLTAIRRAGADLILTYLAREVGELLS